MKSLTILLGFFISFYCHAVKIHGVVIDEGGNNPIAYANISVKGQSIGTISNADGRFTLNIPDEFINEKLAVSFIGYKTQLFEIKELPDLLVVKLKPVQTFLNEVIVNPDSTLLTLLERAYKNIPLNYASSSTIIEGFYSESASTPNGDILYVAEAITKNYKTSYKNSQQGQVKIIKSRKNIIPGSDSINQVKFYGGPFTVHSSDIVHERYGFIKPSKFKDYNYQYLGIIDYNGTRVYSIKFSSKNTDQKKVIKGFMYIEEVSLAYIYFDIIYEGDWIQTTPILAYKHESRKVLYAESKGKWYLKSVVKTDSIHNKMTHHDFVMNSLFVTTNYLSENVKALDYNEQINFEDIFATISYDYNENYWKGYNVLEHDSIGKERLKEQLLESKTDVFLKKEFKEKKSPRDKAIGILTRINFEYGIGVCGVNNSASNASLTFIGQNVINNNISNSKTCLNVEYLFGLKLSKHISINYKGVESLTDGIKVRSNIFMLEYLFCLKRGGKQFFALPSFGYNYGFNGYSMGSINLNQKTTVGSKTLESGKYILCPGKKYQGFVAGLKFKTKISTLLSLVVGADYTYYLKKDDKILFEEDKHFLPQRAFQPFNSSVEYFENGQQVNNSIFEFYNYSFNIGIRLNF